MKARARVVTNTVSAVILCIPETRSQRWSRTELDAQLPFTPLFAPLEVSKCCIDTGLITADNYFQIFGDSNITFDVL